tara:strand:- start:762 stop:1094 length:333 start_codon:yes stop_codon:yes gene_type:complete
MAKNFVQSGAVLDYTASGADVKSGDVVIIGTLGGVALTDIKDGDTGAVQVEGVFTVPKKTGVTIANGAKVYWVSGDSAVGTTASGNTLIGTAVQGAASGATEINVKLNVG